jgi:hypothetical protein
MNDADVWSRNEPASPCVRTCIIHPVEGLCIGCLRTLPEIADWAAMTPAERDTVLDALPGRAPRIGRRRGGRAGRDIP